MTISSTTRLAGPFTGTGTVGTFPFTFKVFLTSDILVVINVAGVETTLALTSDYSVALNADQDNSPGGSITLNPASVTPGIIGGVLANADTLVISSQVPQLQQTTLTNFGGFFPTVINAMVDRLTILCQQVQQLLGRGITAPITDTPGLNYQLGTAATRASKLLAFDASGNVSQSNLTLAQIEALASSGTNANQFFSSTSAGTGNAVTAVAGLSASGYAQGQEFFVEMTAANSIAAPTINFDGNGVKTIKQLISNGKGPLLNNAYYAGFLAMLVYDGVDMVMLNPAQTYGTAGNFQTGTDLTGTDAVNTYNQVDSYNPSSVVGAVGAATNPGISASTSGGTGTVPTNNAANDLIGGANMYAYIAGVYQAAASAVGRVVGAVAGNLGGQYEIWTKKDNGALTKAVTIDQNQLMTLAGGLQTGAQVNAANAGIAIVGNTTSGSQIISLQTNGTQRGVISADSTNAAYLLDSTATGGWGLNNSTHALAPTVDNSYNLGTAANRIAEIIAAQGVVTGITSKVAGQTYTNNATLADVPGCSVNLVAGSSYMVQLKLGFNGSAGGIKVGVGGTATLSLIRGWGFLDTGTFTGAAGGTGATGLFQNNSTSGPGVYHLSFTFDCTSSGTITLQAAQNTANAASQVLNYAQISAERMN